MFLTFCARQSSRRHVLSDSLCGRKKKDFCFSSKPESVFINKRHRADWWMGNRFNAHFLKRYAKRQAFNLDKPYIWEATRGLFFFSCWVGGCFMMRWFVLVFRCGAKTVALPSATGEIWKPASRMTNDWIYPWIGNHVPAKTGGGPNVNTIWI